MSQSATVAWLALRELWMSFRLLVVLVAHVVGGAVVGLLPAAPSESLDRLAAGLGVATVITAATTAWTMADERLAGRAAWLVTRAVSRGTYLAGWFSAVALVASAGVAAAGVLGWLAIGGGLRVDPLAFVATMVGVTATTAVAVALGLLCGSLLRARAAVLVAVAASLVAGGVAWGAAADAPWLPGGAHVLLSGMAVRETVLPDALRAAGIGLALSAALLVAARVALERADL